MKWIIIALVLSYGIAAGDTWALASAPQKPLPTRNAARNATYCITHGGYSLACVLNGKAGGAK